MGPSLWKSQIYFWFLKVEVKFWFFSKMVQPVEKLRNRLKKTYEVKFCFMQKEISYIRFEKRLPIKSLKTAPPYFCKYFSKRKKQILQEVPSNKTLIIKTLSPIGRLRFLGWYHLRNHAPYTPMTAIGLIFQLYINRKGFWNLYSSI